MSTVLFAILAKRRKKATPAPQPATPTVTPWKEWLTLLIGAALAATGTIVAAHYDLGRTVEMDYKGVRATGWAEAFPGGGGYRLSYTHPSGTRYGLLYRKPLAMNGHERIQLDVVYLPDDPEKFQPAGLSYVPGGISLALFGAGMAGILRARRRLTLAIRAQAAARAKSSATSESGP